MKNIVFISGSPRITEQSASKSFIDMAEKFIENEGNKKTFINVRDSIGKKNTQKDFEALSQADVLILAFPLYVFCLPGILTRFFEDYYQFCNEAGKTNTGMKVYTIINCGFPEAGINTEAASVIKSFCRHISAVYRFSILIGAGGMVVGAKDAPFMKRTISKLNATLKRMADDIKNNASQKMDDVVIDANISRSLYFFMGHRGWYASARKNGLKKKDLYKKPYSKPR